MKKHKSFYKFLLFFSNCIFKREKSCACQLDQLRSCLLILLSKALFCSVFILIAPQSNRGPLQPASSSHSMAAALGKTAPQSRISTRLWVITHKTLRRKEPSCNTSVFRKVREKFSTRATVVFILLCTCILNGIASPSHGNRLIFFFFLTRFHKSES